MTSTQPSQEKSTEAKDICFIGFADHYGAHTFVIEKYLGHKVHKFAGVREGLEALANADFSLVLLSDVAYDLPAGCPEKGFVERNSHILGEIKKIKGETPIVIFYIPRPRTHRDPIGTHVDHFGEKYLEAGANDCYDWTGVFEKDHEFPDSEKSILLKKIRKHLKE